jgi:predicted GH43/DUF377 family glycosyl hydrolase
MTKRSDSATEQQGDEFMSVYAASVRLGIATKTVLARVVEGDLEGHSVAGRIVVTRESVERLKKQRARREKEVA